MMVKMQELCSPIKYALRLDWLSNTALADVCLLMFMVEEQPAIAILKIVCKIHDLRVSFLCKKDNQLLLPM